MEEYKPFYWLNEASKIFMSKGYFRNGKTPERRIKEIANRAEEILKIKGFADKFIGYMSKGFYSLSTPVWSNFGEKDKNLPVSCFNSYISDSMSEILRKTAEVGIMSKMGGGTSGYFGDIRGMGSPISSGGVSDGPVRFMELYDKVAKVVSQGSTRRGAFAAYMPADHPDILEFLKINSKKHPIKEMSIGITFTDEFMGKVVSGDSHAREVWSEVVKKRFETGYPYVVFIDNVNNANPQPYKDQGLTVKSQNLCVSGDQRVPTQFGMLTAKELYNLGEELQLFDNEKIVKSSPMKLVEKNADVYKITLENGMSHTITSYHKVLTSKTCPIKGEIKKVKKCEDLVIGDRVAIQTKKGLFGNLNRPKEAFLLGIYQSDGTQYKDLRMFDVWENDFDLLDEIQRAHDFICEKYQTQYVSSRNREYPKPKFVDCVVSTSGIPKKRLSSKACFKALNFEKGYVPSWIFESDEETQWQYLRGLFYADGTVFKSSSKGEPIQISYSDINKEFLKELQLLCANLGLQSSIRLLRKEGETLLPDGKGGRKYYFSKKCWRLIIGNKNDALALEKNTGFLTRKGIELEDRIYQDNTKKYYKIESIEKLEEKEDVYCVKVDSDSHLWVCNGIITHNCAEICLSSTEKESFVCVLSSVNLLHWDKIVETDAIETMVYFLDAVNEEFVRKSKDIEFLEDAHRFAKRHRALGMGVLGWHSLLQSKGIPFEGLQAQFLNQDIFKTIRGRADKATRELAERLGECEVCSGYGRRNTHTMAIAPTTSCVPPKTKFQDGQGETIDFYELFNQGGRNLNDHMTLEIELEDGVIKYLHYYDELKVERKGEVKTIKSFELEEGDDIIEFI